VTRRFMVPNRRPARNAESFAAATAARAGANSATAASSASATSARSPRATPRIRQSLMPLCISVYCSHIWTYLPSRPSPSTRAAGGIPLGNTLFQRVVAGRADPASPIPGPRGAAGGPPNLPAPDRSR
jgi:hypothetical protein